MTNRRGYALPLTLAAIIVIALVAAMAAEQVNRSTQTIIELTDRMRARTSMISAEQTLIYELLTEPMTLDGVALGQVSDAASLIFGSAPSVVGDALIRANGQAYSFGTPTVITRLMDDQAFLNAASLDPGYISDYLDLYGVPREQHARLIATLRDYQDEDDLRSLGGAESSDYDAPGLPRNAPIRDALELCAVMNWAETSVCQDPGRLLLTMRVRSSDQLNPRLASPSILSLMNPHQERAALDETFRLFSAGQYRQFSQIGMARFDLIRDPLSGFTSPGPYLALVTHTPDGSIATRTVIELTPNSLNSPFVVHSKYAIGGDYSQNVLRIESLDDVAPLPQPPELTAER